MEQNKNKTKMASETKSETPVVSHILLIWDESGSMDLMNDEPKQAINEFIENQKKLSVEHIPSLTLYTFSTDVHRKIDKQLLSEVVKFEDYKPNGLTALYDAIGESITYMKEQESFKNTICVILTDGEENASQKFTIKDVENLIQTMKNEHGWHFIFLGANQDAFTAGSQIGVNNCASFDCNIGGMLGITRAVSEGISNMRIGTSDTPIISSVEDKETSVTYDEEKKLDDSYSLPSSAPILTRSSNLNIRRS